MTINGWFADVNAGGTKTIYAIWEKTLTGTFTDTTGSQSASVTIYNGAANGTITAPTQRTAEGWTAKGWTTGTAADSDVTTNFTISADTQYYGRYERTVTVAYDEDGGSAVSDTPVTQQMSAKNAAAWTNPAATLAAAPTHAGYAFDGWEIDGTVYGAGASYTITADVTATAQWGLSTYTVTINPAGGVVSNVTYYKTGTTNADKKTSGEIANATGLTMVHSTTATIALPERDGYTFSTWTVAGAASDGVLTSSTSAESTYKVGAADVTLTAQWTAKTYTLLFDSNMGGDSVVVNAGSKAYNEVVTLPGAEVLNTTYPGWTFTHWVGSADGGEYAKNNTFTLEDVASYKGNETVVMTAVWVASQYLIVYDMNGDYTEDDLVAAGEGQGWTWTSSENEYLSKDGDIGRTSIILSGAFSDAGHGLGDYYYLNTADETRFGLGWSYTATTSTEDMIPFASELTVDDIPLDVLSNATVVDAENGVYEITLYMVWSANYKTLETRLSQFQQTYMTFGDDAATLRGADYSESAYPVYTAAPTSAMLPAMNAVDAAYKANGVRARELYPNTSDPHHGKYAWVAGPMNDTSLSGWNGLNENDANDFTAASLETVNDRYREILEKVIFDPCSQYAEGTILPQASQEDLTTAANRLNEAMNATNIAICATSISTRN